MEPFEVELAAFQEFFSVDKGLLHQKDSFTSKNSWSDLSHNLENLFPQMSLITFSFILQF